MARALPAFTLTFQHLCDWSHDFMLLPSTVYCSTLPICPRSVFTGTRSSWVKHNALALQLCVGAVWLSSDLESSNANGFLSESVRQYKCVNIHTLTFYLRGRNYLFKLLLSVVVILLKFYFNYLNIGAMVMQVNVHCCLFCHYDFYFPFKGFTFHTKNINKIPNL